MEVPGLNPISPLTVVDPVLVTEEPARTAKFPAPANTIGACTVLCVGITMGLPLPVVEELDELFLHPVISAADNNAIAIVVVGFIFVEFDFRYPE